MTMRGHFGTRSSSGETLAALPATVLDRGAPSPGPHPMAETVTTLTTTDFRLVGPLHDISEKVDKGGIPIRLRGQRTNSKFGEDQDVAHQLRICPPGAPVREEFGQLAKRTSGAIGRIRGAHHHSKNWKTPIPPGYFLWKKLASPFHSADSRALDSLHSKCEYSF